MSSFLERAFTFTVLIPLLHYTLAANHVPETGSLGVDFVNMDDSAEVSAPEMTPVGQAQPAAAASAFWKFAAATLQTGSIGSPCVGNATCIGSNGYCSKGVCACNPNLIEEHHLKICKLAPGYNEACHANNVCREPFACNSSSLCDCRQGFIEEYFQCVLEDADVSHPALDCPSGEVAVNETCRPAKRLNENCELSEQCVQSYSTCDKGTCRCVQGSTQADGSCIPSMKCANHQKFIRQCPLGEPARNSVGNVLTCKADLSQRCPQNQYCVFPSFGDSVGFCCPKIKMNCPIGQPLPARNCSSCPWSTHHCFSYVIGSFSESMCCPNACPAMHPIHKNHKCYARVAYGGNCEINEQCYSISGAVCRPSSDTKEKKCLCPNDGPYIQEFGQCIRVSHLDDICSQDRDCRGNTKCVQGICKCMPGWTVGNQKKTCIPKPSCPLSSFPGSASDRRITYCNTSSNSICGQDEFCYNWWKSPASNPIAIGTTTGESAGESYSLCCPKPKTKDFEVLCLSHKLQLLYAPPGREAETQPQQPKRCDFLAFSQMPSLRESRANTSKQPEPFEQCPPHSVCIFDPYLVAKGVCCSQFATASSMVAAVSQLGSNRTVNPQHNLSQGPTLSSFKPENRVAPQTQSQLIGSQGLVNAGAKGINPVKLNNFTSAVPFATTKQPSQSTSPK